MYQLTPPLLGKTPTFISHPVVVPMEFGLEGSQIRYTLDGTEPTMRSALYRRPLRLEPRAQVLKARVFKSGFLPSETLVRTFYRAGFAVQNIAVSPEPNPKYATKGLGILMDKTTGSAAFGDGSWLGFEKAPNVTFEVHLAQKQLVREIWIEVLSNQGAWIFLPEKIEVYQGDTLLASEVVQDASSQIPNENRMVKLRFTPIRTDELRLVATPTQHIPNWHAGKGTTAWFFSSEITVY